MFLTKQDIIALTGYKRRSKQVDALRLMGIRFMINPAGLPVVSADAIGDRAAYTAAPAWQPRSVSEASTKAQGAKKAR